VSDGRRKTMGHRNLAPTRKSAAWLRSLILYRCADAAARRPIPNAAPALRPADCLLVSALWRLELARKLRQSSHSSVMHAYPAPDARSSPLRPRPRGSDHAPASVTVTSRCTMS
jgi:hypothetical protein